ncbi:MAG: HAD family hydrolase [Candidatus Omnitrophica bacterium]|nr:HAD family hydrolase [Candidatus Omnitrophota bacterium]
MPIRYKYDALVFDFDGVLVESEAIKTQALMKLFVDRGRDLVQKIVDYHARNFGISRLVKFRYFHEVLFKETYTPEIEKDLAERFSRLVEEKVIDAPWIAGAREFLETHHHSLPLFIASGTPEGELLRIILKRNMRHYFRSVHGSPPTKANILRKIIGDNGFSPDRVLMVGDSEADYAGASEAKVDFLACSNGSTGLPGPVLPDLKRLEAFIR